MKAAVFYEHGPIENLQYADVPTPVPGPGEVLVRVRAAAINHLDLFVREGIPGINLEFPHWGGSDVAGEVAALGAGVAGWQEGEHVVINPSLWCGKCEYCIAGEESLCVRYRIIGEHVRGGAAEYIAVPAANLFRIPNNYPWEQAAAVPLVFMMAWRSLITQGQLRAGQSVLILGAGGGVASAAIQVAKLAGATVYAASRDEGKRRHAQGIGRGSCARQQRRLRQGDLAVDEQARRGCGAGKCRRGNLESLAALCGEGRTRGGLRRNQRAAGAA